MGIEKRGFASMSAERRRNIARMGGKAGHAQGTAHRWTSDEAQMATRKRWRNAARNGRSLSAQENDAAQAGGDVTQGMTMEGG